MTSPVVALWLAACRGSDPTHPGDPLPDVRVEPDGAWDLGTVLIPCDGGRELQVVNRGTETRRLDDVRLDDANGLALDQDLPDGGLILHPGDPFPFTLRVTAAEPAPVGGTLVVESDEGRWDERVTGDVVYEEQRTDAFVVPPPPVDVVVAVDHGSGMSAYASELARGAPAFVDALTAAADWRMILVTADSGCANGPVFDPSTADDAAAHLADHAFDTAGGSAFTHALLELASKALAENSPTECNGAFERDDVPLLVVTVSDVPDDSQFPWSHWITDYEMYAPTVSVGAVLDGSHCGGGSGGYVDAVQATDGVAVDLCRSGWGTDLADLADAVPDVEPTVVLSAPAVPGTVVARVGGATVDADLDPDGVTVRLRETEPAGASVTVDYAVDPDCGAR